MRRVRKEGDKAIVSSGALCYQLGPYPNSYTISANLFINTFKLLVHKIDPSCLSYSTESQEAPRHTDILMLALFSLRFAFFTSLEDFEARTHDACPIFILLRSMCCLSGEPALGCQLSLSWERNQHKNPGGKAILSHPLLLATDSR